MSGTEFQREKEKVAEIMQKKQAAGKHTHVDSCSRRLRTVSLMVLCSQRRQRKWLGKSKEGSFVLSLTIGEESG